MGSKQDKTAEQVLTSNSQDLPLVSILMVNYNGQPHVKEFFESVFDLNYPRDRFEVVVIDNASKDGSPDWIEKNYPQVRLIRLRKNLGFAGGNNVGVREYCKGEFIALQNSDVVLDKEWLLELVKWAVKEPWAIYGSKMLWYSRRDYIVYGGGKLFSWGGHCHLKTYARDLSDETEPFLVLYADGCGALIGRELFLKLGGFDESYWAYAEDYELSWKAWLAGYKAYFVPAARFYHKVSASFGMRSWAHVYYLVRNEIRNIIKFTEPATMVVMLPTFMAYYLATYLIVYCFQERHFSLIVPILKAYFQIVLEFPSLLQIRKRFQRERKIRDRELKKLGLILSFRESIREAWAILGRKREFWKESIA